MSENLANFDVQFRLVPGSFPPHATEMVAKISAGTAYREAWIERQVWQIAGYPGWYRKRGPARNDGVVDRDNPVYRNNPPSSSDVLAQDGYEYAIFYKFDAGPHFTEPQVLNECLWFAVDPENDDIEYGRNEFERLATIKAEMEKREADGKHRGKEGIPRGHIVDKRTGKMHQNMPHKYIEISVNTETGTVTSYGIG